MSWGQLGCDKDTDNTVRHDSGPGELDGSTTAALDAVALFDAMLSEVSNNYCVDANRVFSFGYSSGSFMSHSLACVRGDVLRGVATIAGRSAGQNCVGSVASLLIHDRDDPTVAIGASEAARDRDLERNGCDATVPTTPSGNEPCELYAGCTSGLPVVWCETQGMGHSRQDSLAAPAFWSFLSSPKLARLHLRYLLLYLRRKSTNPIPTSGGTMS